MTCDVCPHCRATDGVKADCERAKHFVLIRVGKCPEGFFDNSGATKAPTHVYVCEGKRLSYSLAAWERIAACPKVGTKYKVPRGVYEEIKGMRA